jgi:hypothetical protein
MLLSAFQDGFSHALTATPSAAAAPWLAALQAQPGFAVYRNTTAKGCIDALQANYPTVCQLGGEAWFRAAAAVFARAQPPHDGLLMNYGAGFADFLAGFAPAAELPYLPAVARLDRCWTECHLAADAQAITPVWLAQHPPESLGQLNLGPHPAARWAWCDDHPAYTLWRHHREGLPVPEPLHWTGDGGLLARPEAAVTWHPIDRAGVAFMAACAQGQPLEAATAHALAADPHADLTALLRTLLDAGALVSGASSLCSNTATQETA